MLLGMTCVSFFALVLCDLSLSVQLSVGVAISDYCQQPDAARDNFIQMPGNQNSIKFFLTFFCVRMWPAVEKCWRGYLSSQWDGENYVSTDKNERFSKRKPELVRIPGFNGRYQVRSWFIPRAQTVWRHSKRISKNYQ